jgi:tetratricopeptide (TPR) repeat protein
MDLRPGLEAYGRAAHLRWLTGDLAGARTMMEAAVRASSPVDAANCAWVVARLSGYELQAGATQHALALAQSALKVAPGYPPALLAEGKALAAAGRMGEAAEILAEAAALNPIPEYQWWAVDALRAANRGAEAANVEETLLRTGEAGDPRTFALYLATRKEQAAKAVSLADAELENRADPLTYDALAWSEYARGEIAAAQSAMAKAEALHTRDARLALHAAIIALAAGDGATAGRRLAVAESDAGTLTPSERGLLRAEARIVPRGQASRAHPTKQATRGAGTTAGETPNGGARVSAVSSPSLPSG